MDQAASVLLCSPSNPKEHKHVPHCAQSASDSERWLYTSRHWEKGGNLGARRRQGLELWLQSWVGTDPKMAVFYFAQSLNAFQHRTRPPLLFSSPSVSHRTDTDNSRNRDVAFFMFNAPGFVIRGFGVLIIWWYCNLIDCEPIIREARNARLLARLIDWMPDWFFSFLAQIIDWKRLCFAAFVYPCVKPHGAARLATLKN